VSLESDLALDDYARCSTNMSKMKKKDTRTTDPRWMIMKRMMTTMTLGGRTASMTTTTTTRTKTMTMKMKMMTSESATKSPNMK
jgi:hypothetical protein